MANPITWRNVNSRSDAAGVALLNQAGNSFNKAFGALGEITDNIQGDRQAEYDFTVKDNTQQFKDALAKYRTPEEVQAAQQSGELDQLVSGFNGDVDRSVVNQLPGQTINKLREGILNKNQYDASQRELVEQPLFDKFKQEVLSGGDGQSILDNNELKDESSLVDFRNKYNRSQVEQGRVDDKHKRQQDKNWFADNSPRLIKEANESFKAQAKDQEASIKGFAADLGIELNKQGEIVNYDSYSPEVLNQFHNQVDGLPKMSTTEEKVKSFYDNLSTARGVDGNSLNQLTNYYQESLEKPLPASDQAELDKAKVGLKRQYGDISNNLMATQNQNQFQGLSGADAAARITSQFVDEDGEVDEDYKAWIPYIQQAAVNGIEIKVGDSSERVYLPESMLQSSVDGAKSKLIESDGDYDVALRKYLGSLDLVGMQDKANKYEKADKELDQYYNDKRNRNNSEYQTKSLKSRLNGQRSTYRSNREKEAALEKKAAEAKARQEAEVNAPAIAEKAREEYWSRYPDNPANRSVQRNREWIRSLFN